MNNPLVSIVVITYNSSQYIVEGLNSIKDQTYKNIEVIISDDYSTDNTVEICRNWLEKNKHYFQNTLLLTVDKNSGVAGNLNRGINQANGEWVKTLSGDDVFLPNSIEKYVDFVKSNSEAEIVFGKFKFFGTDETFVQTVKKHHEKNLYPKFKLKNKQQYKENLKNLFVPGPGLFYKKNLWSEIGGFDERYPFCEEDPFMYKFFHLGIKLYFLEEEVYGYQVQHNSLGHIGNREKVLTKHLKDRIQFFKDYRRKEMIKNKLFLFAIDESLSYNLLEAYDRDETAKKIIYSVLKLLSPIMYINRFKKIFEVMRNNFNFKK